MDTEKLNLIIAEGEGLTVEFKEKYTPRIVEDITAFSNTKGGHILLGVSDRGEIIGETVTNRLKGDITSLARNCEPPIFVKSILQVDRIVVIEIAEGH